MVIKQTLFYPKCESVKWTYTPSLLQHMMQARMRQRIRARAKGTMTVTIQSGKKSLSGGDSGGLNSPPHARTPEPTVGTGAGGTGLDRSNYGMKGIKQYVRMKVSYLVHRTPSAVSHQDRFAPGYAVDGVCAGAAVFGELPSSFTLSLMSQRRKIQHTCGKGPV